MDSRTDTIVETQHAQRGVIFAGKVLFFREPSLSGWHDIVHFMRPFSLAPAAILFNQMTDKIDLGALLMGPPRCCPHQGDTNDATD